MKIPGSMESQEKVASVEGAYPLNLDEIENLVSNREPRQMPRLRIELWAEATRECEIRTMLDKWIENIPRRTLKEPEAFRGLELLTSTYLGLALQEEMRRSPVTAFEQRSARTK